MDWKYYRSVPKSDSINQPGQGQKKNKTHSSPPGTSSPPEHTDPSTTRSLHGAESALYSVNANLVRASTEFTQEALELVGLEPLRGSLETFGTDGRGDTLIGGTRTIRVEVLVHLNGNVVKRIFESGKGGGVARGGPSPSTSPSYLVYRK